MSPIVNDGLSLSGDYFKGLDEKLEGYTVPQAGPPEAPRQPIAHHTPGPWRFERPTLGSPYAYVVSDHDGRNVAELNDNRTEYEANARLIAAAPELLEAAKAVTRAFGFAPSEDVDLPTEWDDLAAAIAKAEGRQP